MYIYNVYHKETGVYVGAFKAFGEEPPEQDFRTFCNVLGIDKEEHKYSPAPR